MTGAGEFPVRVAQFEGPLALLLRLIEERQLDVTAVSLAEVADQYLRHVEAMRPLDLEAASEFAVIAARLLELKARALVPEPRGGGQDGAPPDEDEPGEDLVRRLLEYRRYRDAAEELRRRAEAEGLRFTRIPEDLEGLAREADLERVTPADLLRAFVDVLEASAARTPPPLEVRREPIPVARRMVEVLRHLRAAGGRAAFHELFAGEPARAEVVATFLAVLELLRQRRLRAVQAEPLGPIELRLPEADGTGP